MGFCRSDLPRLHEGQRLPIASGRAGLGNLVRMPHRDIGRDEAL
jgi:hypothetical protein